ncbi:aminotransferase class I/II-fold pyridoxal phosphate-dependent enzyme [Deinococcus yavapaiensis]|uniref:Succinyldiaminopimelate aminotransferase n=1 Tax=Deinococcus yavapaiensis KR-236 TaxID=694435 RepID=A0A318S3V4_9DEIO|nr:aminotransferase class I/II-fold pyridoxal phosphate-dependent enzyme [Deinococcus yavapaiensis]PYE52740.1 succinyldiaminopimelate aminotransferase [Deinococcus yavapaiensis KR-236]
MPRLPAPPTSGESIFAETTRRATQLGAVNLGQGFPDWEPPEVLRSALRDVLTSDVHQYGPPPGFPRLRAVIAASVKDALGFCPDPDTEVTVTVGASEALYEAAAALVERGDEAIVLEPAYDLYAEVLKRAGAHVIGVPLEASPTGWRLDSDRLRAACTPRTKLIVVNTPHNPTGAVLTREELKGLAQVALDFDLFVVSDEVYDRLTFDRPHVPVASLPGMRERTVTVGAASKTFSVTGWRVGWAIASPEVTRRLRAVHQFVTFVAPTPFQAAIAVAMEAAQESGFYRELASSLRAKRDVLSNALKAAGLSPTSAHGGYFVLADTTTVAPTATEAAERLLSEVGVAGIALSAFYLPTSGASAPNAVRFAFCKRDEVLDEAARRLDAWREHGGAR